MVEMLINHSKAKGKSARIVMLNNFCRSKNCEVCVLLMCAELKKEFLV